MTFRDDMVELAKRYLREMYDFAPDAWCSNARFASGFSTWLRKNPALYCALGPRADSMRRRAWMIGVAFGKSAPAIRIPIGKTRVWGRAGLRPKGEETPVCVDGRRCFFTLDELTREESVV